MQIKKFLPSINEKIIIKGFYQIKESWHVFRILENTIPVMAYR